MFVAKVVEIATDSSGRLPNRLILDIYRASCRELIVLVLNGITPRPINAILDPLVPTLPLRIPGLLYVDLADEDRVREVLASKPLVFPRTLEFRSLAFVFGIRTSQFRSTSWFSEPVGEARVEKPAPSRRSTHAMREELIRVTPEKRAAPHPLIAIAEPLHPPRAPTNC